MPIEIENRLKQQAAKNGLTGDRRNAYVYGTLNKIEKAAGQQPQTPMMRPKKKKKPYA